MTNEDLHQRLAIIDALKNIAATLQFKSGIKLDGLSLRPPHELDSYSMGSGITGRTLEMARTIFGEEVFHDIDGNTGVTIFLGNGSSEVPLEISQNQRSNGREPNTKILIDQTDLYLLLEDLSRIKDELSSKGFSHTFDIGNQQKRVQALIEGSKDDNIVIRTGLIGQDAFRDLAGTGDVVVNLYGPGVRTLESQLAMVKPGGVLYITASAADLARLKDQIGMSTFSMIDRTDEVGSSSLRITRKK